MPFSPSDSQIYAPLFSDVNVAHIFTDEQYGRYLLQVEAALATVQGQLGVIPMSATQKIVAVAQTLQLDFDQLQTSTEKAGLPIINLINQLRSQVGSEAADYVHWGATTQDIMDTALILQCRAALLVIEQAMQEVIKHLAYLADQHRNTLMAGRTHSQQALPLPFGLKIAGWIAPLLRHWQRLAELKPRLLVVQFGGAAGTLASLGTAGLAVQKALALELNLNLLPLPWHTQRDGLAELAGWLSLVTGSLAKMGQDIILMAQTEVGELRESLDLSRGGSSTMPQKSNPVLSEVIIATARTNAALLSSMHHALIQEHERATHSWQVEWLNLPQMIALTSAALNKAHFLSKNLVVNVDQMRYNVTGANGLMLAEAISFALAKHIGRTKAKKLVTEAVQTTFETKQHLVDVVREKTGLSLDWVALKDESAYLGASKELIDQLLWEAQQITTV